MSLLVLDGALLEAALAAAADEEVIVVDPSAARLEQLERSARDPRVFYLIGESAVLGGSVEPELRRVLRT